MFVDLHAVFKQAVRAGVEKYSLKDLEPLHGFERVINLQDLSKQKSMLEFLLESGQLEEIPEELINTQVCVVANLKPATIKGLLSQGMLLAAKDKEGLCLVRPERPRQTGASLG